MGRNSVKVWVIVIHAMVHGYPVDTLPRFKIAFPSEQSCTKFRSWLVADQRPDVACIALDAVDENGNVKQSPAH